MAEPHENAIPLEDSPETTAPPDCLNCGEPLRGRYCYRCGQQDQAVVRFFPALVLEFLDGLFAFDSRTYRSLWYLFTRPAFLTREYLAGRRVRYLPPLRLFIVFVLLALFSISFELFLESQGIVVDSQGQPEPALVTDADSGLDQDPDSDSDSDSDSDDMVEEVSVFLLQLELPWLSEETNQRVVTALQQRAEQNLPAIREDPGEFVAQLLDSVPILMLFLIPLLALLQKLVYVTSHRYFIEHLVLTIHNHSFLFFAFVVMFLLDLAALSGLSFVVLSTGVLSTLIGFWVLIYLFLSLRRMFEQGYFITTVKFIFISTVYGAVLLVGILIMMFIGFLTF